LDENDGGRAGSFRKHPVAYRSRKGSLIAWLIYTKALSMHESDSSSVHDPQNSKDSIINIVGLHNFKSKLKISHNDGKGRQLVTMEAAYPSLQQIDVPLRFAYLCDPPERRSEPFFDPKLV